MLLLTELDCFARPLHQFVKRLLLGMAAVQLRYLGYIISVLVLLDDNGIFSFHYMESLKHPEGTFFKFVES